jgi:hypothetical protein
MAGALENHQGTVTRIVPTRNPSAPPPGRPLVDLASGIYPPPFTVFTCLAYLLRSLVWLLAGQCSPVPCIDFPGGANRDREAVSNVAEENTTCEQSSDRRSLRNGYVRRNKVPLTVQYWTVLGSSRR